MPTRQVSAFVRVDPAVRLHLVSDLASVVIFSSGRLPFCLSPVFVFISHGVRCPASAALAPSGAARAEDCIAAGGAAPETTACTVGYYIKVDAGTTTCTACVHGYFKATIGRADRCTGCPAFSNTTAVAATMVTACECNAGYQGELRGISSANTCILCPRGTFKDIAGSGSCKNCPDDLKSNTLGLGSTSVEACIQTGECAADAWCVK
jgi:hypothetical protein